MMQRFERQNREFSAERHRLRSLKSDIDDINDTLRIIERQNKQILSALKGSRRREREMARTLDEALAAMEKNNTVEEGLYTLIDSLKAQAAAVGLKPEDQAKIDKIFDQAEAQSARAATALMTGTSSDPVVTGSLGGAQPTE